MQTSEVLEMFGRGIILSEHLLLIRSFTSFRRRESLQKLYKRKHQTSLHYSLWYHKYGVVKEVKQFRGKQASKILRPKLCGYYVLSRCPCVSTLNSQQSGMLTRRHSDVHILFWFGYLLHRYPKSTQTCCCKDLKNIFIMSGAYSMCEIKNMIKNQLSLRLTIF